MKNKKRYIIRIISGLMSLFMMLMIVPISVSAAAMAMNVLSKTLYLNEDNVTNMPSEYDFSIKNKPANYKTKYTFKWYADNDSIIDVAKGGVVTALKVGTTKVKCDIITKSTGKLASTASATVTVKANAQTVVINNAPENNQMTAGDIFDFNRTMKSANGGQATDKSEWLIWGTDVNGAEAEVASVNDSGVVTALAAGTFTLKVRTYQSAVTKSVTTAESDPITITVLPLCDHSESTDQPTCTDDAVCTVCGMTIPSGHKFINYLSNNDATCTADGTATAKCERCDVRETIIIEGSRHHTWDSGKITVYPSCNSEGNMEYICTCEGCTATKNEPLSMTEHEPVIDAGEEPTCTKTGLTEGSHCKNCGKVIVEQQTVSVADHEPVIDEAVEPTCTETGLTEGSHCKYCGKVIVEQQTVSVADHEPVIDEAVEPTCTETGLTEGSHCKNCGKVLTERQPVQTIAHEPVIDAAVEPTCTKTGLTGGSHCKNCGKVFVERQPIPMSEHEPVIDAGEEPTCTKTGLTDGYHCKNCGKVLAERQPVSMKAHTFTKYISDGNATHLADGTKTAKCDYCDATEAITDEGSKLTEHSYGEWEDSKDGENHVKICACGDRIPEVHQWDTGEIIREATSAENGIITYTCKKCGTEKTENMAYASLQVTEGAGSKWEKGSEETLNFVTEEEIEDIVEIRVDGVAVVNPVISRETGKTVATLSSLQLSSLDEGEHKIEIVSRNGVASTLFTVLADRDDETTDTETSDTSEVPVTEPVTETTAELITDAETEAPQTGKPESESPQTGDAGITAAVSLLMLSGIAVAGVIFSRKRKTV